MGSRDVTYCRAYKRDAMGRVTHLAFGDEVRELWHAERRYVLREANMTAIEAEREIRAILFTACEKFATRVGHAQWPPAWNTQTLSEKLVPEQWEAVHAFVGEPIRIVMIEGACSDCRHAYEGRERGSSYPCRLCKMPQHSLFEAS